MKVTLVTFVLVVGFAVLAGCGGGGDKTFEGDGFSFTYPGDWVAGEYINPNPDVIAPAVALTYAGPEERSRDSLSVTVAPDQASITEDNLDAWVEEIAAYATDAYGQLLAGPTPTTVGGLPALRLEASSGPTTEGVPVQFRTTLRVRGDDLVCDCVRVRSSSC